MMDLLTHPIVLAEVAIVSGLLLAVVLVGRNLSVRVGSIHAELKPNGGNTKTLGDSVVRIEAKFDAAVDSLRKRLDHIETQCKERHDAHA